MHVAARDFVKECIAHIAANDGPYDRDLDDDHTPIVVEFGSRDVNGTIRDLFVDSIYTGVDICAGSGVDVIANAAVWRTATLADIVVCCEVLEHTEQAFRIVRNACRTIDVGGYVIITCATDPRLPHSAADGGEVREGEYYRNIPSAEFMSWIQAMPDYELPIIYTTDDGDLQALVERIL